MLEPVRFNVRGTPAPQGSKTTWKNPKTGQIMQKEASDAVRPWRADVSAEAARQRAAIGQAMTGPLKLDIIFRLSMPASRPLWAKAQGFMLREISPDLDKLVRAVGDACKTGGLIGDDSLFAIMHVAKVEVWEQWTGASIRISALDPRAFKWEMPLAPVRAGGQP